MQPIFVTSGDMTTDRRYEIAQQYFLRGDLDAAADVMRQAVERAPDFASGWFALGEIQDARGMRDEAIAAFHKACAYDPDDRHGAGLHLVRLGARPMQEMPAAYVRTLFDQYAPGFNNALLNTLNYRGPRVLRDAVFDVLQSEGREPSFVKAIDLGCGTGLAARAFTKTTGEMIGYDLSPGMVAQAQATGLYDRLDVADMVEALRGEADASADFIFAADAVVYLSNLSPLIGEAARVLMPEGLLAFTTETHAGKGVILGDGLRYAHSAGYLREAVGKAGLALLKLEEVSTRDEAGKAVPGLVVVARKDG